MKVYLITLLVLMSLTLVSAADAVEGIDLRIKDGRLTAEGFIVSDFYGKVPVEFFSPINDSLGSTSLNCSEVTIGNTTCQTDCSISLDYHREIPFKFNDSVSTIIGTTELEERYNNCLEEKNQYKITADREYRERLDLISYEANYTQCSTELQICENNLANKESELSKANQEIEDNKNNGWLLGGVGIVVGIVGTMYLTGRWKKGIKKDDETYSLNQAA